MTYDPYFSPVVAHSETIEVYESTGAPFTGNISHIPLHLPTHRVTEV